VNVISAEIDTVGAEVDDTFYLTYKGAALSEGMETLVRNALQYHLDLGSMDGDHSY